MFVILSLGDIQADPDHDGHVRHRVHLLHDPYLLPACYLEEVEGRDLSLYYSLDSPSTPNIAERVHLVHGGRGFGEVRLRHPSSENGKVRRAFFENVKKLPGEYCLCKFLCKEYETVKLYI